MHKLSPTRAFLITAAILIACSFAFGQQTTGSIEGTVKDSAGALVPNVTVTITNAKATSTETTTTGIAGGFKQTVTTSDDGSFRVLRVPPGMYDVVTTPSSGFGEARYENVTVVIGQSTQVAVTVNPGNTSTVVDIVASEAIAVDPTSNAVQTTIRTRSGHGL